MIRAVVDINILLSAVVAPLGAPRRIVLGWEAGAFAPIVSQGMRDVRDEKLRLRRIVQRYHLTDDDRDWIQGLLRDFAENTAIADEDVAVVTGDPEDDYVLATVRLSQADYLVTGDKGLLALDSHEGTQIVSPRDFLNILERAAEEP